MTNPNIHQRIIAVMRAVDYIQKEKKPGMNYTIVSHDKVTAKVRPHLVEQGITYRPVRVAYGQDGNRTNCHMTVRFTNADNPEEYIDVESFGYGVDAQDKGPGKAMSYAVKYALLKLLGLETGDEPDEVQDERANHIPDYVFELDRFIDAINLAVTDDDLAAAKARFDGALEKASRTHPANVARIKQAFLARKRALAELLPA